MAHLACAKRTHTHTSHIRTQNTFRAPEHLASIRNMYSANINVLRTFRICPTRGKQRARLYKFTFDIESHHYTFASCVCVRSGNVADSELFALGHLLIASIARVQFFVHIICNPLTHPEWCNEESFHSVCVCVCVLFLFYYSPSAQRSIYRLRHILVRRPLFAFGLMHMADLMASHCIFQQSVRY